MLCFNASTKELFRARYKQFENKRDLYLSPIADAALTGHLDLIPKYYFELLAYHQANYQLFGNLSTCCEQSHNFLEDINFEFLNTEKNVRTNILLSTCAATGNRANDKEKSRAVYLLANKHNIDNSESRKNFKLGMYNFDLHGHTAVYYATATNCPITLKTLLDFGAKIDFSYYEHNWQNETYYTSLIGIAAFSNAYDCLKILLETQIISQQQKVTYITQVLELETNKTLIEILQENHLQVSRKILTTLLQYLNDSITPARNYMTERTAVITPDTHSEPDYYQTCAFNCTIM